MALFVLCCIIVKHEMKLVFNISVRFLPFIEQGHASTELIMIDKIISLMVMFMCMCVLYNCNPVMLHFLDCY